MSYIAFDPYSTKVEEYLKTIDAELNQIGFTIKIPVAVPALIQKAYNAISYLGVVSLQDNTIFAIRKSDYWLFYSEKTAWPAHLFNFLAYYKTVKKEVHAPQMLEIDCENICNAVKPINYLANTPVSLEIYSTEAAKIFLDLYRSNAEFGLENKICDQVVGNILQTKFNNIKKDMSSAYEFISNRN